MRWKEYLQKLEYGKLAQEARRQSRVDPTPAT